jgi:hypothetical protein
MESFKIIDNSAEKVLLEVNSVTESGKKIVARYLLKQEKPFVEIQPREGIEKILVDMKSRHTVIPDLFGADLVVNAQDIQASSVRLPSENMLLQFADNGDAITMCIWRSGDQKVRIILDGTGESRNVTATEIECSEDKVLSVWVAVLAAPGIWHQKKVSELDPVKHTKLDWKIPFQALWRSDYQRQDGLVDSWKLIIKKEKGEWEGFGIGPKKDGTVWHAARGTFGYPAHIESDSAFLRNIKYESLPKLKYKLESPVIIYPLQRSSESPKNFFGVLEILKETLIETPEFTLADDIQVKSIPRGRYPGVCYTTGECEKIFDAKEEKKKRKEIVDRLQKMSFFNIVVRSRIEEDMDWWKKTHEWCIKKRTENLQLAGLIDELDGMLAKIPKDYDQLKLQERTPAAAHVLVEKFIAMIDIDEDKKDEKVNQFGRDLRTIASNQDHATGVFRMFIKEARQRAGYRMLEAKDDASFEFGRELRWRTREILQTSLGVEGGFTD